MPDTQSHEAIVAQVKAIAAEILKKTPDEINENDDFTDMGADSLDRITMIVMLEDALKMSISDTDAKTLKTVAEVVRYIEAMNN